MDFRGSPAVNDDKSRADETVTTFDYGGDVAIMVTDLDVAVDSNYYLKNLLALLNAVITEQKSIIWSKLQFNFYLWKDFSSPIW